MKISKLVSNVLAAVVLSIGYFGCTASQQSLLMEKECASVFPWADDCNSLTTPDGLLYYEAWERGYADDVDDFLGYVFPKTFIDEGDTMKILIGLTASKRISKIIILGYHPDSEEFLSQFQGKSSADSFEIAVTTDDLLTVPSKIKPIKDDVPFSRAVSEAVKDVMIATVSIKSL